jgi:hypothetical protein
LSWVIRRVTAAPASWALPAVSRVFTEILRPFTPPAALRSETASWMPLSVDWPKVACAPLIEP